LTWPPASAILALAREARGKRGRCGRRERAFKNPALPRDHWLEAWEQQAIVDFAPAHPRNGYRRLTFMMLDQDVVAVSPASVYRVLAICVWRPARRAAGVT